MLFPVTVCVCPSVFPSLSEVSASLLDSVPVDTAHSTVLSVACWSVSSGLSTCPSVRSALLYLVVSLWMQRIWLCWALHDGLCLSVCLPVHLWGQHFCNWWCPCRYSIFDCIEHCMMVCVCLSVFSSISEVSAKVLRVVDTVHLTVLSIAWWFVSVCLSSHQSVRSALQYFVVSL